VLAAGSFTHFLVAVVLIWVVLVAIGIGTGQVTTTIDRTVATTAAGDPAPARAPASLRRCAPPSRSSRWGRATRTAIPIRACWNGSPRLEHGSTGRTVTAR